MDHGPKISVRSGQAMRRVVILILVVVACLGTLAPTSGTAAAASGPVVGGYSRVHNSAYLRMRTGPG